MARVSKEEKEKTQAALDVLSMIYDKVQKSKTHDRFIVASKDGWGVTDGIGNVIIPTKFTRITCSNDTFFRVYGELTGVVNFGYEIKYQGVYDYDGNEILPLGVYGSCVSFCNGLIFGQCYNTSGIDSENGFSLVYVRYDKKIYTFDDISQIFVIEGIDDMLMGINSNKEAVIIRIDNEIKVNALDKAWDKITSIDLSSLEAEDLIEFSGEKCKKLWNKIDKHNLKDNSIDDCEVFEDRTYEIIARVYNASSIQKVYIAEYKGKQHVLGASLVPCLIVPEVNKVRNTKHIIYR